jgi:small-conductance mechanosensitive channel
MFDWLLAQDPWTIATVAAVAAVIGGLVAHRVGGAILRRATRKAPLLHAIVEAIEPPASIALPLFALQAVWEGAPDELAHVAAARHVNGVLLILAMTWLAMAAVSGLAQGVMARYPTNIADNLQARRIETQARILSRTAMTVILIAGASIALMSFPGARHVGASLLASAGVIGLVAGLAARPVFSNLIAGLQLAIAQPIRIGDVLKVKDDWGTVEEITGTYVVLRVWDDRRQIIPLTWFIENPFENWTRTTSDLQGTVLLRLNYATPIPPLREHARKIVEAAPEWDKRVCAVQVEDTTEGAIVVRILVSAWHPQQLWDLRCRVREDMLAWLAREYPQYIPPMRPVAPPPPVPG